jgi:hypothetical protein
VVGAIVGQMMMRIHYAGGSGLTGTAIATSLITFAEQLARTGTAATVDIPVRNSDGTLGRSMFLIGPASQMVAEHEDSPYDEVVDEDAIRDLERRAEALRPHQALNEPAQVYDVDWDLEPD